MTNRGYKRSWKNLLINKRYQLRFTLFMVGLAVVLMALLGWWVVRVASEATTVAQSRVRGTLCPEAPVMEATAQVVVDPGEMTFDEPGPFDSAPADARAPLGANGTPEPTAGAGSGAGSDAAPAAGSGHTIVMDEPSMTIKVTLPEHFVDKIVIHYECELLRAGRVAGLKQGQRRIELVLVASGVLIVIGLVLFGIKMTHRVAGPLYKVTLYLAKLRDGRYDKVYDLRRGDQLVEFYEHFRQAHAGVVALEQGDRDRIAAALDAAAADGLFDRSPEAKACADELRAILERKEKALGHKP